MSNGFYAQLAGVDHADIFAAVAPVAGTRGVICNPSRPVSVLEAHGKFADLLVPFNGGAVRGRRAQPFHLGCELGGSLAGGRWVSGRSVGGGSCLDVGDGTMVPFRFQLMCAGTEVISTRSTMADITWPGGRHIRLLSGRPRAFDGSQVIAHHTHGD